MNTTDSNEQPGEAVWWVEFIDRWNAKYPTTPLYDTKNCKLYVQRAVRFILTNSIDVDAPVIWPSRAVGAALGDEIQVIDYLTALEHQTHRNHAYNHEHCNECSLTFTIACRLRERLGIELFPAATTSSPAAQPSLPAEPDHDSCSHWREGDSDNCVWCGDDAGDPDAIHEYVSAEVLSEIREVLEGLRTDECWCTKIDGHTNACLATRALYQKVQKENGAQ